MQQPMAMSSGPNAERRFRRARRVAAAWCGKELVLLDGARGRYYTLNRTGGRLWEMLDAPASVGECTERLRLEQGGNGKPDAASVAADITQLMDGLARLGLVESAATVSPPPFRTRRRDVVACMASIARIKHSLRRRGLAATLRRLRARRAASYAGGDERLVIAYWERVVSLAAAFYPGRALCLERSLTLYARLWREGVVAELRLGVQATPFAAHAWVAYDGEPVNDTVERTSQYVVMPEPAS